VLLVHHDVKPLNGRPDERDKPQRMSGGGIFSATDAPIHAELVGDVGSRTLLAPARYKFSVTPNPFLVSIESNDPKRPTWVRIEGAESTSAAASELVLHQKIRDYLLEHPGISGNKIATAIRGNKARVLSALDEMLKSGDADFYQVGQAKHWTILTGGAEAQR
jgi:hypothetical protein